MPLWLLCGYLLQGGDYFFLPPLPLPPLPLPFFFLPGGTIPRAIMSAFKSSTAVYFFRMI